MNGEVASTQKRSRRKCEESLADWPVDRMSRKSLAAGIRTANRWLGLAAHNDEVLSEKFDNPVREGLRDCQPELTMSEGANEMPAISYN